MTTRTYGHIGIVIAFTGLVQAQTKSRYNEEVCMKSHPLEVLEIGREKNQLFLMVYPLISWPHST